VRISCIEVTILSERRRRGGNDMRETGQKKLGLFSPITSREDALETTKGAAQAFYGLAALQTVLGVVMGAHID
jgi:hypothetical protein